MKSLFLCAGEGTRLRPWTTIKPKPALPCMSVPLAAFPTFWARELGALEVCVNVHHLGHRIRDVFASAPLADLRAQFSDETGLLMGPAGALKIAEKHLKGDGDFLVMNGDEVFLPEREGYLPEARRVHRANGALATLVVMKHPEAGTTFGAVWADRSGRVRGFGKTRPSAELEPWHFIGAYFADEALLELVPADRASNIFYDILCHKLEQQLVQIFPVTGLWQETGNIKDYLLAHRRLIDVMKSKSPGFGSVFLSRLLATNPRPLELETHTTGDLLRPTGLAVPRGLSVSGFLVVGDGSVLPETGVFHDVVIDANVPPARITSSESTLIL